MVLSASGCHLKWIDVDERVFINVIFIKSHSVFHVPDKAKDSQLQNSSLVFVPRKYGILSISAGVYSTLVYPIVFLYMKELRLENLLSFMADYVKWICPSLEFSITNLLELVKNIIRLFKICSEKSV